MKSFLYLFILGFWLFSLLFSPLYTFAQAPGEDCGRPGYPACPDRSGKSNTQFGCGDGFGPFASILCNSNVNSKGFLGGIFDKFFSNILGFLTAIAGLFFLFQIVTAGIAWIGSGGDKNNLEAARNKMMNAIIGLVVVVSAWVLVGVIGQFVGLDILNVGNMIDKLRL